MSTGIASAQETSLDYTKITAYLIGKYGAKCKEKPDKDGKATECILQGDEYRLVPMVRVNVFENSKTIGYSLSVRVNDPSSIENFDGVYQDTVGALADPGNDMKSVAPNIYAAMRLCFEKSELGKNDRINCRYLPETGPDTRMSFFGDASGYFELNLGTYKKK